MHKTLEEKFEERLDIRHRSSCSDMCSFCRGDCNPSTSKVSKKVLTSVLDVIVFVDGNATTQHFVDSLKKMKDKIWSDCKSVLVGQVHRLMLQLWVNHIREDTKRTRRKYQRLGMATNSLGADAVLQ